MTRRSTTLKRKSPPKPSSVRAARPTRKHPDPTTALERLLDNPSIASKRWVYEQYDSSVQGNTAVAPGDGDAGVFQVPGETFGIATTVDCNSRWVALDPYEGGKATVAEAARNLACSGAEPLGVTDCLNFGNPEKPEIFFQFREACRGISDACRAFNTPVTGGNVSFYNESPTGAIDPTPTVGMVGLLRDVTRRAASSFAAPGDLVVIAAPRRAAISADPPIGPACSALWAALRHRSTSTPNAPSSSSLCGDPGGPRDLGA
jgi:phosphoribosylformylglycinamidine synthase